MRTTPIECKEFHINYPEDIYNALMEIDNAFETHPKPHYREDYIFDEEKSVRWNREEVQRQNQQMDHDTQIQVALRTESRNNLVSRLSI